MNSLVSQKQFFHSKRIVFNDNSLNISDIDDQIIKTRVIMINENEELLLMKYINNYFLSGGGINNGGECYR